jgi:hypothetical protein
VLVLRCTRKLLDRVGPPVADPPASTTLLGDWYAKPFAIAQKRFILLVSAETRIAVVMPGRDVANLPRNFPDALAVVLARLGIPADAIQREVTASRDVVLATTDSRSLLGTLNDGASWLKFRQRDRSDIDVVAMSVSLCHSPSGALGFRFPADLARCLFGLESYPRALS